MTNKHEQERSDCIYAMLIGLVPGFCTVRLGCVIWRVDLFQWLVGVNGFDVNSKPVMIEEAVTYIRKCEKGMMT